MKHRRALCVALLAGVTVLSLQPAFGAPGRTAQPAGRWGTRLWLPPAAFDPLSAPQVDARMAASEFGDLYFAQMDLSRGTAVGQQVLMARVRADGGRILGYLPEAAYLVRVAPDKVGDLRRVARAVVPFHPAYRVQGAVLNTAPGKQVVAYTLPDANTLSLARDLLSRGIRVVSAAGRAVTLVSPGRSLLQDLARDARVMSVNPQGIYTAFNQDSRWVTQSAQRDVTPLTTVGLDGTGEAVGAADTGLNYYPDHSGQANMYFSDCVHPLAPTRAECKLADVTYQANPAAASGDIVTGAMNYHNGASAATNSHGAGNRKVLGYFNEVVDTQYGTTTNEADGGAPDGPNWHGDSGTSTHGSHVGGSIAGNQPQLNPNGTVAGYSGLGSYDGEAPQAKLVFQDIGTDGESLGGLPGDLYRLFDQSYDLASDTTQDNAEVGTDVNDIEPGTNGPETEPTAADYTRGVTPRIHSNSWGSFIPVVSLGNSPRLDDFVVTHEDFLPVFAAGNSGPQGATIGEPGTAKDALTVGATANGRDDYASLDTMASFSSHGVDLGTLAAPIVDSLGIKPDVSTPGLHMISAKGGTDAAVQVLQGTSMATPTAAGDAVLVHQYFDDGYGPAGGQGLAPGTKNANPAYKPSAALVKAVMISSAQRMRGSYTGGDGTVATNGQWPSAGQGWGRVQLDQGMHFAALPNSPDLCVQDVTHGLGHPATNPLTVGPLLNLCSANSGTTPPHTGITTGQTADYSLGVTAGHPLKVILNWSDPGGLSSFLGVGPESETNYLALEVDAPNGTRFCGNAINTMTSPGADVATTVANSECAPVTGSAPVDAATAIAFSPQLQFNNVQGVYLPAPVSGTYRVKVRGIFVASPQDTIGGPVDQGCLNDLTGNGQGTNCTQGYAVAATGNFGTATAPTTPVAGTPVITPGVVTSVSGDAAVVNWTTDKPTTGSATITGPGGRTLADDYSYSASDYPGLSLLQIETAGPGPPSGFLHRPVLSTSHTVKFTGLSPGQTYSLSYSVQDEAGDPATANGPPFSTPSSSFAPTQSTDTATVFSQTVSAGPVTAGIPPIPITDPTAADPWGKSSQLYEGQLPTTVQQLQPGLPLQIEQVLGAFKFTIPKGTDLSHVTGATVLLATRHDLTSHVQETPSATLDLLTEGSDAAWGPGTSYNTILGDAAAARAFPQASHLRASALNWQAFNFTCGPDLTALVQNLSDNGQAAFRVSGADHKLAEDLFAWESGFGRRASGLEFRPLLVLQNSVSDAIHDAGGTPTIGNVTIERQGANVVAYWDTAVASNSLVLVNVAGQVFQVGAPAYTKIHQVQVNLVSPGLGATFAVRSTSSDGNVVTSSAFAVPDASGLTPPGPGKAVAAAGDFSTVGADLPPTAADIHHGSGYGCLAVVLPANGSPNTSGSPLGALPALLLMLAGLIGSGIALRLYRARQLAG